MATYTQYREHCDKTAMGIARKQASTDRHEGKGPVYRLGERQARSGVVVDSKWGTVGCTNAIMAAIELLAGDVGTTEAAIKAYTHNLPCGRADANGKPVGNRGFFAYALGNGWLVEVEGTRPTPTTTDDKPATKRKPIASDSKPKAKRKRKNRELASATDTATPSELASDAVADSLDNLRDAIDLGNDVTPALAEVASAQSALDALDADTVTA